MKNTGEEGNEVENRKGKKSPLVKQLVNLQGGHILGLSSLSQEIHVLACGSPLDMTPSLRSRASGRGSPLPQYYCGEKEKSRPRATGQRREDREHFSRDVPPSWGGSLWLH